ncbi:sensor domain-containing diguanylate cyclase [Nocardia altamirensis]|uniref:sensor domain-containing diguanylate cyclase n=1 Tax=Nocardia altamirensis TaxID=472158 RepID=UPI000A0610BC|nr:sensor domain-containing diguanylate cyclase [Nocardia altamirensis]
MRWADALDGAVAPTLTRTQIEAMLADLGAALMNVVRGSTDLAVARDAATVLVAANYRDAVAVSRSVVVICRDLVDELCPTREGQEYERIRDRAVLAAAEFAAGFTAALRMAALAEQEATLVASLAAAQEAEARRQLSEARFAAVFAGASVGIGTIDVAGNVLDANAAMAEMLGLPVEVMPGRSVAELIGEANIGYAFEELQRMLAGESDRFRMETEHLRPDGTTTTIDLSMSSVRDSAGQIAFLIGVAVDVTERKQLADRLWHDANHDSLTGLPNRGLFFDRLANAVPPIGVCYLDLDGFKEINDVWGHTVGDRVLRVVGQRLQSAVETVDGLVARLGGDEFIVLVEKCPCAGKLTEISEWLARALTEPMEVEHHLVSVAASIGTVFLDEVPTAPDQLMHAADTAMYRNKATGTRFRQR